ncbi:hypothetical protein [Diaphorobacter sp.]|uniref:hypothetical protein n=1 Tax=Diaphorobacter sp. TaxID=1934310 RepID=UPI002586A984|nr:hypothetical protein [Diaphorobacter sp.]
MMEKVPFVLTDHACQRQVQRCGMSLEHFLQKANDHAILVIHEKADSRYWLLWLKEERRAHAFVATDKGAVITVFPALQKNGVGGVMRDAQRATGIARMKSSMLLNAIAAAGAAPEDAAELLDALRGYEARLMTPRSWNYVWVLRYTVTAEDGRFRGKNARIGKARDLDEELDEDVLVNAQEILKESGGWDAEVVLQDRDTGEEVVQLAL